MDPWSKVWNSVLTVLIGTQDEPVYVVLALMYIVGLWGIFQKCGLKSWWALVPLARTYKLALCADRELEGRTLVITEAGMMLSQLGTSLLPVDSALYAILGLIFIPLMLISLIYQIRVFLGLIKVFDRRKRWILLWLFADGIPAIIWGFGKKYQPLWQASEIRDDAGEFFSSVSPSPAKYVGAFRAIWPTTVSGPLYLLRKTMS